MTTPQVMRIMALSINTAARAGSIIREVMQRGNLGIVEKEGKDDLQTEADRSAQQCIIASLSRKFPNVKVIGEEGDSNLDVKDEWLISEENEEFLTHKCPEDLREVKEEDFVVWVDPLDGTSEYTQGLLDHVTVLIGVAIKDRAVGGVIYQPYYKQTNGSLGRTIWGLKGLGTGGIEPKTAPKGQMIITTTRSHLTPLVQQALDALSPTEVIKVGGAGFKVLQLLEGKAHAYVFASPGCKRWDTCAPEAVLEAWGGTLTDLAGIHYSYAANVEFKNRMGVLATIPEISHSDIAGKVPKEVLEALRS
ncbi:PREDICTED: 3'(2'),5'-bisphosphate nucleotidase 1-like [Rhagoletis zephyria]|uniref:3'(2'),5'-bisphosphate nucleotidase 1-like n=1 Tax=Rhagoletis zephyria TaxID=28612 RepID=UPI0008119330|nr:PREDICTED: 3'(2'),5'-bisphosphate nucleotidase 1-like [Rhagoletis zephyria]